MLILPQPTAQVAAEIAAGMKAGRHVHLVNFHSTPHCRADDYRRKIEALARYYGPMDIADLDRHMAGDRSTDRPGLIPVLFEGLRDNYDVILPMIEQHGFIAWFFIPTAFLGVPAEQQRRFAADHMLRYPVDEYPRDRIAMTWAEARDALARGHVIGCHSNTHAAVAPDTPDDMLEQEIVAAKREMEQELDAGVDLYCWRHGAECGVNPRADRMLREAGFRYLFSNFKLQRLH